MDWERIDENTWRAKVYKGWVVKVYSTFDESFSVCFVPDPMHAWPNPN